MWCLVFLFLFCSLNEASPLCMEWTSEKECLRLGSPSCAWCNGTANATCVELRCLEEMDSFCGFGNWTGSILSIEHGLPFPCSIEKAMIALIFVVPVVFGLCGTLIMLFLSRKDEELFLPENQGDFQSVLGAGLVPGMLCGYGIFPGLIAIIRASQGDQFAELGPNISFSVACLLYCVDYLIARGEIDREGGRISHFVEKIVLMVVMFLLWLLKKIAPLSNFEKDVAQYVIAWLSCLFAFGSAVIVLQKHYQSRVKKLLCVFAVALFLSVLAAVVTFSIAQAHMLSNLRANMMFTLLGLAFMFFMCVIIEKAHRAKLFHNANKYSVISNL